MPYATADLTQIMGLGGYVGEIRQGPDGQLYEWVEGVDGLGNLFGFWKKFKQIASGVLKNAMPLVKMIPGVGPAITLAQGAIRAASPLLKQIMPIAKAIPGLAPALETGMKFAQDAGILGLGEIAQGPDGQLYEVVEGIGAQGEPRRFLRRVWLSIPATIRPRRVLQQPVVPVPAPTPVVPVVPQAAPAPVVVRPAPARAAAAVRPAAPVYRRFR